MVRLCDRCGRVAERGAYYHYFFGRSIRTGTPVNTSKRAIMRTYAISGRDAAWICTRCTGAAMVRSAVFFVAGPLLLILGLMLGPNPVTGAGILQWAVPAGFFAGCFGDCAGIAGFCTLALLDLFCIGAGGLLWYVGTGLFLTAGDEDGSILAIEARRFFHEARGDDAFFTPREYLRLEFRYGYWQR
jgi:hypothetical protein